MGGEERVRSVGLAWWRLGGGRGTDYSEAAGVGDGGGEFGITDPLHTALDYGNCGSC